MENDPFRIKDAWRDEVPDNTIIVEESIMRREVMGFELPPLSINKFSEITGMDFEGWGVYALAYYVQQNQDRLSDKEKGQYEKQLEESNIVEVRLAIYNNRSKLDEE